MPLPSAAIPALVALLGALVLRWLVTRYERHPPELGWAEPRPRSQTVLVMLGALAAQAPLLAILPRLLSPHSLLPGDAMGHAGVAHAIARHGLPHGWVDAYYGGFPFGLHYQTVPLLLLAGLMRLGVDPVVATNSLGLLGVLTVPVLYAALASRAGASAPAALLGACVLAWAVAVKKFIAGPGIYLDEGLFSQAVAMPVLLATAGVVLLGPRAAGARTRPAVILGALCIACHVQATAALLTAALPVCLLAGGPGIRRRSLEATGGAVVFGVAAYGPGLVRFHVPFSWVKVPSWKILGFGPSGFLRRLAEGLWFDADRAPVLTVAAVGACCLLLLLPSRAGRAALGFFVAVCGLSALGESFAGLGSLGQKLVEVYSPVRLMIFLPLAAAIVITVGSHELMAHLADVARDRGWSERRASRSVGGLMGAAMLALAAGALPGHVAWARQRGSCERDWTGTRQCGEHTPAGFDAELVGSWVSELRGGRLAVDHASFSVACRLRGLDVRSSSPLDMHTGGPGTQVGIASSGFSAVRPEFAGSAARAEAMGVRWVLVAGEPPPPDGWRVRRRQGSVLLLERQGGTDEVGVGCVAAEWSGPDRALRDALQAELDQPRNLLDTPHELTVLTEKPGPLTRRALPREPCDAEDARVEPVAREPGAYQARVVSPAPVDVVIRATYVPEWRVTVDRMAVPYRKVAPGFLSVRVPAGAHELEAVVSLPRGYWFGMVGAGALVLAATFGEWLRERWRRRSVARSASVAPGA